MARVIPGLAMAGLWLVLLLQGSFLLFYPVLLLGALIAAREFVSMSCSKSSSMEQWLFSSILITPLLFLAFQDPRLLVPGLLSAFLILSIYSIHSYTDAQQTFQMISRVGLGLFYIGFLAAHLVLIFDLENGNRWLIVLTAITAGSDSGAYYCGRRFGRRKLCPLISPNKTVEGAVGGVVSGVLAGVIMALLVCKDFQFSFLLPVAACLAVIGIYGDLSESILKRATATKDSGTILAGHGGVLDRMDSLLFAGPVLYYLLLLQG
ncbi:MAG: phosphatidate cytidylyltransferase [Thermodesulfobacteriota bacterium]